MAQGAGGADALSGQRKTLTAEQLDFRDAAQLRAALRDVDAVVHTAGPYLGDQPDVLAVRADACFGICCMVLAAAWLRAASSRLLA